MLRRNAPWFAMLLAAAALGCVMSPHPGGSADAQDSDAHTHAKPTPIPLSPEAQAELQKDSMLRSQVDVEMSAQWDTPGLVRVTIMNKTPNPIRVGPENFALLLPPNHTLIQPLAAARKMFPVADLGPNEQASGQLPFPPLAGGGEARLAFDHPNLQPAFARVR